MRFGALFSALCLLVLGSLPVFPQTKNVNRYEVEMLSNPNAGKKDTREVNSVIIFEVDKVIVKSRRNSEIFKEIKYSDIKFTEHSFSKRPWLSQTAVSLVATLVSAFPIYVGNNEKHWLSVVANDDFFVLKLENDNFRQIKAEFAIKNVEVEDIIDGKDSRKSSKPKDLPKTAKEKDSND